METKVFKKKYERIDKHISGIPKPILGVNHYKPSIYNEDVVDPKLNIPSNKELFKTVIKDQEKEEDEE